MKATTLVCILSVFTMSNIAYPYYDNYQIRIMPYTGIQEYISGIYGSYPGSHDGYDLWDEVIPEDGVERINIGVYKMEGENDWDGPTGFYYKDIRLPLIAEYGSHEVWRLHVWATQGVPANQKIMTIGLDYGGGVISWDSSLAVTFELVAKPEGIEGGPDIGTVWQTKPPRNVIGDFPIYRTDNGLEGYVFDLTVTVIPEPASILILSAGLAGMAGAIHRRRKD